jgi:hypothetical protein
MEVRGLGNTLLKAIGGIGIVVASFFVSLLVMDSWGNNGATEPKPSILIKIEEATYGANCRRSVKAGNATLLVAKSCDGRVSCNFFISVEELGDPAPGCGKDFSVRFKCDEQRPAHTVRLAIQFVSTAKQIAQPLASIAASQHRAMLRRQSCGSGFGWTPKSSANRVSILSCLNSLDKKCR